MGLAVICMHPSSTSWPSGVFQCGPASVNAIREGEVNLNYDMIFIFAEVSADRTTWIYNKKDGSQKQNSVDTRSIGKYISTKAVGSNSRMDVTIMYKHPEGRIGAGGCHMGLGDGWTALRVAIKEAFSRCSYISASSTEVPGCSKRSTVVFNWDRGIKDSYNTWGT